jgi:hypothetical protein
LPSDTPSIPADLAHDPSFFGPIVHSLVQLNGASGCATDSGSVCKRPGECPGDATGQSCELAQRALGIWLIRNARLTVPADQSSRAPEYPYVGLRVSVALAAARRFAALPATQQHWWLRRHYRALRHGQVSISVLP